MDRLQQMGLGNLTPLRVVMLQEAQRLNRLVTCVRDMVHHLRKGVTGLLVMSEDLESLQCFLLSGKVPPCWHFAFPSLKPLTSWATDVAERVDQINKWGLVSRFRTVRLSTGVLRYFGLFAATSPGSRRAHYATSAREMALGLPDCIGRGVRAFRTDNPKRSGWAGSHIRAPS